MNRRNSRKQSSRKHVHLPVTVRQAQKLILNSNVLLYNLAEALEMPYDRFVIKKYLDRMAQVDPDRLIQSKEDEYEDYGSSDDYYDDNEEDENAEGGADSPTHESNQDSESPQNDCESDLEQQNPESTKQSQSQPQESQGSSGQGSGDGVPQGGQAEPVDRSASDAPQSDRSETGEAKGEQPSSESTSEDGEQGGNAQNSSHQSGASLSMALGDEERTDGKTMMHSPCENQPRDAASQESGDSQTPDASDAPPSQGGKGDCASDDSEVGSDAGTQAIENPVGEDVPQHAEAVGNQPGDDRPTHQKKWGKKFSIAEKAKLSANANTNHGGITAELKNIGVDAKLLKLCRQRLAALVGDSSQEYSYRRDYQEFCVRLKTYRNPQPARIEEQGRPVILILADVSGSCSSFSGQAIAVAKAASKLGVPGADVLVLTHSNGYPWELEYNSKSIPVKFISTQSEYEYTHNNAVWYEALTNCFQIQICIALGDWDAADDYVRLALHPVVEHFIWLDNAHCSSRGTVQDRTKMALSRIQEQGLGQVSRICHKLIYRDGCKDAIGFIENIKI